HAVARAGRNIDGVVADAIARDDLHPAVRPGNGGLRHALQVDVQRIVPGGNLRRDLRIAAIDPLPLDSGPTEHLERLAAEDRLAARVAQVAEDTDLERHALPPTACRIRL